MTQAHTTRKIGIIAAVLTTLALTVTMVAAGNAHFVGTPSITTSGSTVTVSGKVAGLGNIPQIHVEFTADASCINPGDHHPKAANKQSVGGAGDFPVQNGKANFSLSATAVFQPDCTPPMTLVWSNIQITVTADDGTFLTYP
jgi:hypothetical protein